MSLKRAILAALGILLFVIGYAGLWPLNASRLLPVYSVGFSATPEGWHILGAIGGAAAVAGIWALSSAFRRAH